MSLKKTLSELGLNDKKANVYLACLELGTAKVQDIAKKADIRRTTAYDILDYLVDRGLVSTLEKQKARFYLAEEPKRLKRMIQEKEQALEDVLPELESLYNVPITKPHIKFYKGIEGIKTVYEDILTTRDKKLLGILSMVDLYEVLGEKYMENYIKRRIESGISLRVIRSKAKEAYATRWQTNSRELREQRYAPEGMIFTMTQYVYDNKAILISSQRENFGLIIESEEFSQNQRNLFEVLWRASRN